MVGGKNEHVALPAHAKLTVEVKLFGADRVIVNVVMVVPTRRVLVRLLAERVKGLAPVPVSETDCGLPVAVSVTVIPPGRDPPRLGVKLTLNVQEPPGLITFGSTPQLLVWAKSPLILMLLMVIATRLVFSITTVCTGLVVPTA